LSNEEKTNDYEHFEKGMIYMKRGGGVEKRGEEKTKSMPHAPVIPAFSFPCPKFFLPNPTFAFLAQSFSFLIQHYSFLAQSFSFQVQPYSFLSQSFFF
jgi:hypothetical protein